jgi:tetratricopeptide (TPR) repeat protein
VDEHVAVRTDVPLAQLVVHLRRRQLLDAGSHGDRGSRTLRAVFDLSVDKFPSHVARFFGLLGVFPTPWITAEAAAVLTGLPLADAERMFDVLVGAHLVGQVSEGSYRLHDLLHLYAEEHARSHETPDVLADCVHRMVDWYLHSGINAMRTISPQEPAVPALSENTTVVPHEFADADDARRWFLAEQKNILGISMCAAKYHMHDHMWRLVGTFSELLNHYCDPNDIVDVHRQAVASARIDGARDGESGILNSLGAIEFQRGDYGSAARYFKQALTIFEEIDDQQGEAVSLLNIGNTYVKRGRWRSALPFHNRSLAIFESIGDQSGQARVHHWLGKAHQRDGQFEVAGDYFLRSLDVSTEIADEHGQTLALAELSELCLARGELVAAKDYCSKAVEIGAGIFDQKIVSGVLRTQAAVCLKLGDCEGAARSAAKAEVLCRSTNDLRGSADALEISARAYGLMGDRARAERSWVLALELYEKLGDAQADRVRDELRRFRTDDD